MLAVVGLAVSCLLVLGFYGYVFMQLYQEHKLFAAREKRLHEHRYAMQPAPGGRTGLGKTVTSTEFPGPARKETLIHVGVAIGGLVGLFAEIGFLYLLVNSFH